MNAIVEQQAEIKRQQEQLQQQQRQLAALKTLVCRSQPAEDVCKSSASASEAR